MRSRSLANASIIATVMLVPALSGAQIESPADTADVEPLEAEPDDDAAAPESDPPIASEDDPSASEGECFPECRTGYLCHQGECISACNPPCEGE